MEKLTVNRDGIEVLIDQLMYRLFVVYGRKIELNKVLQIMKDESIDVPQVIIEESYQFTQDQYDYNERDGWNDQEYPNRKK